MKRYNYIYIVLVLLVAIGISSKAFAANKEAQQEQVIMWNIQPLNGASVQDAQLITNVIASEIEKWHKKVLTEQDINKLVAIEQKRQECGNDTECVAEIGNALGVREVIMGSLGRLGNTWILSLQRIDSLKVQVIRRSSVTSKGEIDSMLNLIPSMIQELFGKEARESKEAAQPVTKQEPEAPQYPMNPYKLWGHVTFWSGLGIAALGGAFTGLAFSAKQKADDATTSKEISDAESEMNTYNTIAITSYITGGALMATGIVLWILSPGDEAWAKQHGVSAGASVLPNVGAYVNVRFSW